MTFKHTTPNHSSESLSTFRTYFRTYKRLTLTGILAVMSVLSITYAATRITSITQTATKGDSITAEWVNEVNAALQTGISGSARKTGECYIFSGATQFWNIIEQNVTMPESITLKALSPHNMGPGTNRQLPGRHRITEISALYNENNHTARVLFQSLTLGWDNNMPLGKLNGVFGAVSPPSYRQAHAEIFLGNGGAICY